MSKDSYIGQNATHFFRRNESMGLYMRNKRTAVIEKIHITNREFKKLCYGIE